MENKKLTVILPCAGEGSRLSIATPKELFPITKGKALIDFTFELFNGCSRSQVEFAITITDKKLSLVNYLKKYSDQFDLKFIYFNNEFSEFHGSIKSAEPIIGGKNLILLPDSKIKPRNNDFYNDIMTSFDKQNQFFVAKKSNDHGFLRSKGCLHINANNVVEKYSDKPNSTTEYNGVWAGVAFSREKFEESLNVLESSTIHTEGYQQIFSSSGFNSSKVVLVDEYQDLGTWEDIEKFYCS